MKNILLILVVVFVLVAVSFGSWKVQRYVHYKFSYESQVAKQIQPIVDRVNALEKRIVVLENKK